MKDLYKRAKAGQWDGDKDLAWNTNVDPLNPEVPLFRSAFDFRTEAASLDERAARLNYSMAAGCSAFLTASRARSSRPPR
jgi:hypothetical protein